MSDQSSNGTGPAPTPGASAAADTNPAAAAPTPPAPAHVAPPPRSLPGGGETRRHVLVAIVMNKPGVLNRVSSLMRARNFNIDSLAVSKTDREDTSRMTITLHGDDVAVEQAAKQLYRLIDVLKVQDVTSDPTVEHELAFVKIRATDSNRDEVLRLVELSRGRVVDLADGSVIVEVTGTESEIDTFVSLVRTYGIKELVRTGAVVMARGSGSIEEAIKTMTAKMYYDNDADPSALAGQTVAIIGYGSQGHAHALNLHESGVDVIVGLAPGSKSRALASDAGLRVSDVSDAVRDADVVMILVPDTSQKAVYDAEIGPHLRAGHLLMFAHGFNLRFGRIDPPGIVDVGMVAPKGPGHLLRSVYQAGGGVPALFAVERDQSGTARDRVLAYARAIGSTRAGVLETTFAEETETDLFGEQSVLCGGTSALVKMAFETLVEAGYQPELAYFETMHELKLIVDLMYRGGLNFMRFSVSDTAEYGDYVSGPRLIDESVRERMQAVLKDIQDGSFANRWIEENETGRHEFERLRQADHDHLIERVGGRLRAQMPFLNPVEVQAGQAQAAATTPGAAR